MRNFNKGSINRGSDRGGARREDKQMHRATCTDCGKSCEVPFKPTGSKPIYCSNCFKPDRADAPRSGGSRGDSRGESKYGAPSRSDAPRPDNNAQNVAKFEELNKKLDRILILLDRINPPNVIKVPKKVEKVKIVEENPKAKATPKKTVAKKKAVVKEKAVAKKKSATKAKATVNKKVSAKK